VGRKTIQSINQQPMHRMDPAIPCKMLTVVNEPHFGSGIFLLIESQFGDRFYL